MSPDGSAARRAPVVDTDLPGIGPLVGASPAFRTVLGRIRRLAMVDATVLIEGETGTGKELAARALHYLGARRGGSFIPVNCGALPDTLMESEIFGHVRGSFTDGRDNRAGLVTAADRGTLFLDEIECLSPKGQVVLLRFLQDGLYRPVGGREERRSNVRVVVASNCELAALARAGGFRSDLLYRLAIVSLRMPPLRERPEDVALLARHFLNRYAHAYRLDAASLDSAALMQLERHAWPGNVRELENVIHGAVVLADGPAIRVSAACLRNGAASGAAAAPVPEAHDEAAPSRPVDPAEPAATIRIPFELDYRRAKTRVVSEFERAYLEHVLSQAEGNLSRAARLCGKERSRLGRLIRKHRIIRTDFAAVLDPP